MTRVLATCAALCLLATGAAGQVTLGTSPVGGVSFQLAPTRGPRPQPASPVTPITPARPSPPPDLFRAGPDTYAPRYDRPVPPPIVPYAIGGHVALPERIVERTVVVFAPTPGAASHQTRAEIPSAVPAPAAADRPTRGHQRPLYVIPNCYLGDRPPSPARLPPGCTGSARQLR